MSYTGRAKIFCDEKEITADNVSAVLASAMLYHNTNSVEIDYLYNYRRGIQPVLLREKEVRPEICNKIVENRADEIVSFKTGYLCGEPLQYVSRGSTDTVSKGIQQLNDAMMLVGKPVLDKEIAEWMYTCGTGYRMVLPNSPYIKGVVEPWLRGEGTLDPDEAAFNVFTLDPRYAFVIYYSGLGERPIAGVKYITKEDKSRVYSVYTANEYFELTEGAGEYAITEQRKQAMRMVPIIEYPLNSARLGAFEVVLSILDAINTTQSNRVDGVEQFIQSLMVLYNADLDGEDFEKLRAAGLIKIKSPDGNKADVKIINEALDQMQTQALVDYMYQTVLDIVGMPNRNGGSSTSDTGLAVQLRDGWSNAESRAKSDELCFKDSERLFLKAVLRILRDTISTPLTLADIETKFTRRIYEGLVAKSQVLVNMLSTDKIAPSLAFAHCGLFSDPEDAAKQSAEHYEKAKSEAKAQEAAAAARQAATQPATDTDSNKPTKA